MLLDALQGFGSIYAYIYIYVYNMYIGLFKV